MGRKQQAAAPETSEQQPFARSSYLCPLVSPFPCPNLEGTSSSRSSPENLLSQIDVDSAPTHGEVRRAGGHAIPDDGHLVVTAGGDGDTVARQVHGDTLSRAGSHVQRIGASESLRPAHGEDQQAVNNVRGVRGAGDVDLPGGPRLGLTLSILTVIPVCAEVSEAVPTTAIPSMKKTGRG